MTSPVEGDLDGQMDVDSAPRTCTNPNAYFGTKRYFNNVRPTNPSNITSIQELNDEYKQFSLLKKKDELAPSPEAGTSAYLVSAVWMEQYMKYILFEQFKNDVAEHNLKIDLDTHFTKMHPGSINNDADLCEEDKNGENLFGTGKVKGFE